MEMQCRWKMILRENTRDHFISKVIRGKMNSQVCKWSILALFGMLHYLENKEELVNSLW